MRDNSESEAGSGVVGRGGEWLEEVFPWVEVGAMA